MLMLLLLYYTSFNASDILTRVDLRPCWAVCSCKKKWEGLSMCRKHSTTAPWSKARGTRCHVSRTGPRLVHNLPALPGLADYHPQSAFHNLKSEVRHLHGDESWKRQHPPYMLFACFWVWKTFKVAPYLLPGLQWTPIQNHERSEDSNIHENEKHVTGPCMRSSQSSCYKYDMTNCLTSTILWERATPLWRLQKKQNTRLWEVCCSPAAVSQKVYATNIVGNNQANPI